MPAVLRRVITGRSRSVVVLLLLPVLLFLVYMCFGKYTVPISALFDFGAEGTTEHMVLFGIRLPRALVAMLFGACMGISGSAMQTSLRNPLASPYILGISSGAGFGAALAIALIGQGRSILVQPSAAIFALVAIAITLSLSRLRNQVSTVSIVLAGVIVSAFFSGLLSLLQILVEPEQTQTIVAWLIGRLNTTTWHDFAVSAPFALVGIAGLLFFRWRLFVLSMGDEEAASLGVNVARERTLIIVFAALAVAAVVSVAGIIGWVCLIAPHITRFVVGSNPKVLLPASLSVGASFMLLADLISRTVWTYEIPVGIITTLIGAPLFLYLMRRSMN